LVLSVGGKALYLFAQSNWFLVFLEFFSFGLSSVSFCLLISAFVTRTSVSAIVGVAWLYILGQLSSFLISSSSSVKILASFLSPLAFR